MQISEHIDKQAGSIQQSIVAAVAVGGSRQELDVYCYSLLENTLQMVGSDQVRGPQSSMN